MKIFAGFDLASESVEYCVAGERGRGLKRGKMSWSKRRWAEFVKKYGRENLVVAFETGPEAHRAEKQFRSLGVETYPFHAGHFDGRRTRKNDRLDAKKMCKSLRAGSLPRRIVLTEDEEALLRNWTTARELTLKQLTQCRNRIRGLARQWGVRLPRYDKDHAQEWWGEVTERFPKRLQGMIQQQVRTGLTLLQNLDEQEEAIAEQMERTNLKEPAKRLMTMPGIGPVVGAGGVAYLGDGTRFTSNRKSGCYAGLVPTVKQTGKGKPRLGHVTKEGPPVLRRLFVEAAHVAVRTRSFRRTPLFDWYERLRKRRGRKIAIVALARKMIIIATRILRDETTWDPEKLHCGG
jgi:transposase